MSAADKSLVERLRSMFSHRGDGTPTQYVNPDGPEAADRLERLTAIVEAFVDIERGTDETGFTPTVEQMLMDLATEARAALNEGTGQ